jgi:hypothetical protein
MLNQNNRVRYQMLRAGAAAAVAFSVSVLPAQAQKTDKPEPSGPPVKVDPRNPSGNQMQPQGQTGPIHTQSGGAPASSPQGQSPPGMQAAPQGSDKTIRTEPGGAPRR